MPVACHTVGAWLLKPSDTYQTDICELLINQNGHCQTISYGSLNNHLQFGKEKQMLVVSQTEYG